MENKREKGELESRKKQKRNTPRKIIGGVLMDMELAVEVDWQKRRKEIIQRIQKDEEDRKRKIEKSKKLQIIGRRTQRMENSGRKKRGPRSEE